jgi:hypothetical protein
VSEAFDPAQIIVWALAVVVVLICAFFALFFLRLCLEVLGSLMP